MASRFGVYSANSRRSQSRNLSRSSTAGPYQEFRWTSWFILRLRYSGKLRRESGSLSTARIGWTLALIRKRFRRFLNREAPFPDSTSLVIAVSGNPNPQLSATFPYENARRVSRTRQFRFYIPGIAFWLHNGEQPEYLKEFCAGRTGRILLVPDLIKICIDEALPAIERTKLSGSLRNSS